MIDKKQYTLKNKSMALYSFVIHVKLVQSVSHVVFEHTSTMYSV